MRAPLRALLAVLSCLLIATLAATTDETCVRACSDYSVVLGHCRQIYGDLQYMQNMTFANEFVNCICTGQENDAVLGNDALSTSVGICQSCQMTPGKIKDDLSMLMDLCVVQVSNGTASEAIHFMPVGYTTSEANIGGSLGDSWESPEKTGEGARTRLGVSSSLSVGVAFFVAITLLR